MAVAVSRPGLHEVDQRAVLVVGFYLGRRLGLIVVVGDDNNDFIFIGSSREFEAPRDGTLFLGVNEGNLEDNSGAFETKVEIEAIDATAQK